MCDIETKASQSSQWVPKESPQLRKARQVQSNISHDNSFFFSKNIVRHEFLPQGMAVNNECYLELMKHFCEAVRKVQCVEVKLMDAPWRQSAHNTLLLIHQVL